MFKLVLVDDRKDIVTGIAQAVDWKSRGVEISCFYNGKDALEYIMKEQPDMVITDICMPYITGLELVKKVSVSYPHIKFIVLTGYDNFSYAKEAIHLGIVEYISKPIRIELLEELVEKQKIAFEKEKQQKQGMVDMKIKYKRSLPIMKEKWFQEFYQKKASFDAIELNLELQNFSVAIIERDRENAQGDDGLFLYAVENIAKEILGKEWKCEAFQYEENKIVFVMNYNHNQNNIVNHYGFFSKLKEVQGYVEEYFKETISVGLGSCYKEAEGIRISFAEARKALQHKLYFGNNSMISIFDIPKEEIKDQVYPIEKEKGIIRSIKLNKGEIEKEIMEYFHLLNNMKNFSPVQMKDKVLHLVLRIYNECSVMQDLQLITLIDEYRKLKTLEDIKSWFHNRAMGLAQELEGENNSIRKDILKVKKYIDEHYAESITLKKMGDYIYISQSYLSFIFKEIMKVNFNEYLTIVRIEKAKEFLDNDYKVYEVCGMVGYVDKKYFSDLFKKYTGVLPKEWIKKKGNRNGVEAENL
jgi:Response regulator containing CheY-like receiver domain and AraC-type DNA-binding domain